MGTLSKVKQGMVMTAKKLVQGYRATSESYIAHLRSLGVELGDDVVIFSPGRTNIETLNPHLLTIGSHVAMTGPVTILTHDYSVGVTKIWTHGEVLGSQKPVTIGNNVFIGWGATILAGTTIGDNCVIGAGSVVSGRIEGDSIWGGVPGKRICSLEEYYERRKRKQLDEAVEIYRRYKLRFRKVPPKEVFHEYFYIFTSSPDDLCDVFRQKLDDHDNADECMNWLSSHNPLFDSFDSFCEYAEGRVSHT